MPAPIVITISNPTDLRDIHSNLTSLFDMLLSDGNITNADDLGKLARLKAQTDIILR